MALSVKRGLFIEEYLKDFNATRAAIRAGYSKKSAHDTGHEILKNPEVRAEISRRLKEQAMGAEETLHRLGQQARNEGSDYLRPDGSTDFRRLIAEGKGHLVQRVRIKRYVEGRGEEATEVELVDAEFVDPQAALFTMAKHHDLLNENRERTVNVRVLSLPELLKKVYGEGGDVDG